MTDLTRRSILAAIALSTPLALGACGGDDQTGSTGAAKDGGATGGTLTYVTGPEPVGLDPANLQVTAGSGHGGRGYAVFGMLLGVDSEKGDVVPGIADSLESTTDLASWTLKLKDGVKFTDGTPFDAEAVKYNWERHTDPKLGSVQASIAGRIKSMKASDATTLEITLKEPLAQWPSLVAGGLTFIGSPEALKDKGKEFAGSPVGAGPFIFESWRRNDAVEYKPNPDYYAGAPKLEHLTIRSVPDEQQRADTVTSGSDMIARITNPQTAADLKTNGATVHVVDVSGGTTFIMNFQKAPFDDARVREALWLTFDHKDYNETVFGGNATTPTNYFAEGSPYFTPEVKFPEPDLAKAQQLIDEYTKDKGSVSFSIQTQQPGPAEYLQQTFQQLKGVKVKVEQLAGPTQVGNAFSGNFVASTLGIQVVTPAPQFHDEFRTGGSRNFGKYSSEVVDKALAEIEASADLDEQRKGYAKVQEQLIKDHAEMITARVNGMDVLNEGVIVPQWFSDGIPALDRASVGN